jgi:hypothetical protein
MLKQALRYAAYTCIIDAVHVGPRGKASRLYSRGARFKYRLKHRPV